MPHAVTNLVALGGGALLGMTGFNGWQRLWVANVERDQWRWRTWDEETEELRGQGVGSGSWIQPALGKGPLLSTTMLGENVGEKVVSGSLRGGGYKALWAHHRRSGRFCLVGRKTSFVLILLLYFTVFSCLHLLLGSGERVVVVMVILLFFFFFFYMVYFLISFLAMSVEYKPFRILLMISLGG